MASLRDTSLTADRTTGIGADSVRNANQTLMVERLRALLPPWFADTAPNLDGLLTGPAALLTYARSFTAYAKTQTRVATATGRFLDLAAFDFFRSRFQRRANETDANYQLRIRKEVLRPRQTRAAITRAVTELTGIAPDIFEPFNPGDCGAYGSGTLAYGTAAVDPAQTAGYGGVQGGYGSGHFAYQVPSPVYGAAGGSGAYGSLLLNNQIFVKVRRPTTVFRDIGLTGGYGAGMLAYGGGQPPATVAGYAGLTGGYGVGDIAYRPPNGAGIVASAGYYVSPSEQTSITDEEIYATVAETVAAGVIAWTSIRGA